MDAMKVHLLKISKALGGECRGRLCSRLNKACDNGMNLTDSKTVVTCAFCPRILAARTA